MDPANEVGLCLCSVDTASSGVGLHCGAWYQVVVIDAPWMCLKHHFMQIMSDETAASNHIFFLMIGLADEHPDFVLSRKKSLSLNACCFYNMPAVPCNY